MYDICDVISLSELTSVTFDWSSADGDNQDVEDMLALNLSVHKTLKHLSFVLLPGHCCEYSDYSDSEDDCAIPYQWQAAINVLSIAPQLLEGVTFIFVIPEDDVKEPRKNIDHCSQFADALGSGMVKIDSSALVLRAPSVCSCSAKANL